MPRNTSTNSRLHRIPTHVVRTRSLKQRYYLVFAQLFPELTLHYWFSGPCTIGYKLPTIGLYRVKMTGSSRRTHCTCSWRRLVLYLLDSRRFSSFPGDVRLLPGDLRGWNARGYIIFGTGQQKKKSATRGWVSCLVRASKILFWNFFFFFFFLLFLVL